MAAIHVTRRFTMGLADLRAELDQLAAQLGQRSALTCAWQDERCLDFRLSGAEGQVNIRGQEVELTVRLGFLMSAFRGTIEEEIEKFFAEKIY